MPNPKRLVAIVGALGVHPMVRLSLPGRRLLAYLCLRGHPVARNVAAAELWPDQPEDVGRANLRRALWHLPTGWVSVQGTDLILEAETDLARARQTAYRAIAGEPLTLEEITTLLSSDILPGWNEEWLVAAQDSFHLLRVQALEAACRTMAKAGNYVLATQAGAAAVAAEPLSESAAEALISAHLAQHNRHQAAQCFKCLEQRLRAELGVAPDPALIQRLVAVGIGRYSSQ
jgi:DNA-binding SARP family transcriptional activator